MPLPTPTFTHGYVVGRYALSIGDTTDDTDALPDFTGAQGVVRFTPLTKQTVTAGPLPVTVFPQPVAGEIKDGILTDSSGREGIWLVVGDYSVTYQITGGTAVPGPALIHVTADRTQANPIDLSTEPEAVPTGPTYTLPTWFEAANAQVQQAAAEASASAAVATAAKNTVTTQIPVLVADAMADDATIEAAAVNAMSDASVQALLAWVKPTVTAGTDLNTVQTPGLHPVNSTTHPNQPIAAVGAIEVIPMGTWLVQRFVAGDGTPRSMQRRKVVTGGNDVWNAWEPTSLRLGEATGSTDLNTEIMAGQRGYNTTTAPNQPVPVAGTLEVIRVGSVGVTHRYTTWEAAPRVFYRRGSTGGTFPWTTWSQSPDQAVIDALRNELLATIASASGSGMKVVPLAFTLPGGTVTRTMATGSARWVRKYAHAPSRIRLHVSNRNPANLSAADAVTLVGARIGIGDPATGVITSQVDAIPANTALPVSTTAELVGPWIDFDGLDGDGVGITLAWSGGGLQQMLQGGGWTVDNSTTGWDGNALPAGAVKSAANATTPFYVWIEAEVPARVPVVGSVGDSIVIGTYTTTPVSDSWLAQYALAENALPVIYAQHGSNSTHWVAGNSRWTSLYPGVTPALDAMILALGRNDVVVGATDATMRTRMNDVRAAVVSMWPRTPIHLSTITPFISEDATAGAERRLHNAWRLTKPNGERGVFDFAAAISNAGDTAIAAGMSADTLHPNTAGQTAMAATVIAKPVTPFALTEAKMRSL